MAVFPSSLGLLEGKTLPEVERKVKLVRGQSTHPRAALTSSRGLQHGKRP
jgi:hypothetical protein